MFLDLCNISVCLDDLNKLLGCILLMIWSKIRSILQAPRLCSWCLLNWCCQDLETHQSTECARFLTGIENYLSEYPNWFDLNWELLTYHSHIYCWIYHFTGNQDVKKTPKTPKTLHSLAFKDRRNWHIRSARIENSLGDSNHHTSHNYYHIFIVVFLNYFQENMM